MSRSVTTLGFGCWCGNPEIQVKQVPKALVFYFSERQTAWERPSWTATAMFLVNPPRFLLHRFSFGVYGVYESRRRDKAAFKLCNRMAPAHAPIFVGAVAGFGREQPGRGVKKRSEKWYIEQNWVLFSLKSTLLIQSVPRTNLAATLRTNHLVLKLSNSIPGSNSIFSLPLFAVLGRALGSRVARSPLLVRVSISGRY